MLPWVKTHPMEILSYQAVAYHRLQHMLNKVATDAKLSAKLVEVFKEYTERDFIEKTSLQQLKT